MQPTVARCAACHDFGSNIYCLQTVHIERE